MDFVTDFADQAVLLPVALVVGLGLVLLRWWRGAFAWGLSVVAVLAAMLVLKLVFVACGNLVAAWHVHSPSGHTAGATIIYGGGTVLLGRVLWGGAAPVLLPATLVAAFIGLSRVLLGAHSWPEVLLGAAVGLGGALLLVRLSGPVPAGLRLGGLPVVAVCVMLALHGVHLPAEQVIHRIAPGFWPLSLCQRP